LEVKENRLEWPVFYVCQFALDRVSFRAAERKLPMSSNAQKARS
jgi:hypothetical protein